MTDPEIMKGGVVKGTSSYFIANAHTCNDYTRFIRGKGDLLKKYGAHRPRPRIHRWPTTPL